ncbi:unnamed protein product, partial [marine sediment metagenome]
AILVTKVAASVVTVGVVVDADVVKVASLPSAVPAEFLAWALKW